MLLLGFSFTKATYILNTLHFHSNYWCFFHNVLKTTVEFSSIPTLKFKRRSFIIKFGNLFWLPDLNNFNFQLNMSGREEISKKNIVLGYQCFIAEKKSLWCLFMDILVFIDYFPSMINFLMDRYTYFGIYIIFPTITRMKNKTKYAIEDILTVLTTTSNNNSAVPYRNNDNLIEPNFFL